MAWDWAARGLSDIGTKFTNFIKGMVPAIAIFEFISWLVKKFWSDSVNWVIEKVDNLVQDVLSNLKVDLELPMEYVDKINTIIPLEEAWHYLLLYLAIASVMLGIKWARNLIPTAS